MKKRWRLFSFYYAYTLVVVVYYFSLILCREMERHCGKCIVCTAHTNNRLTYNKVPLNLLRILSCVCTTLRNSSYTKY